MIIFVTSVSRPWAHLIAHGRRLVREHGSGQSRLIVHAKQRNEREQLQLGDNMLAMPEFSGGGFAIVVSFSEYALLRLLRRIRDRHASMDRRPWSHLEVHVLDATPLHGFPDGGAQTLRVDRTGEFIDHWPEGFFVGCTSELF